jgi:hypothetical protein
MRLARVVGVLAAAINSRMARLAERGKASPAAASGRVGVEGGALVGGLGPRRGPMSVAFDADRLEDYWESLAMLEHRLGHHPLVRKPRFELEALAMLPPASLDRDAQ